MEDKHVNLANRCITLHQPWATLLVMGVKCIESRTWRTQHRGVLWIHSSTAGVTKENLALAQKFYPDFELANLPQGCILGSVTLTSVVRKDEYIRVKQKEDCLFDYAWLCENPRMLKVPVVFKGRQRIYKIPDDVKSKLAEAEFEENVSYVKGSSVLNPCTKVEHVLPADHPKRLRRGGNVAI